MIIGLCGGGFPDVRRALLRENVTITPHIGGVRHESYAAMAATFAANVRRLHTGEPLAHCAI